MPRRQRKRLRVSSQATDDDSPEEVEDLCSSSSDDLELPTTVNILGPHAQNTLNAHAHTTETWVDVYANISAQTGLLVSARKAKEVKEWLTQALQGTAPRLLILSGPPGCGKSSAIRTISRDLSCAVNSWTAPHVGSRGISAALLQDFHAFAVGTRYSSLTVGDHRCEAHKSSNERHILLVEDFPVTSSDMQHFREDLRRTLRSAATYSPHPTVIILSDSARSVASSVRLLLGAQLLECSDIASINIPAATDAMMKKRLREVLAIEGFTVSQKCLETVVASVAGDCRAALNCLQFSSMSSTSGSRSARGFKTSGRTRNGTVPKRARPHPPISVACIEDVSMDGSLGIFHAISKILNNKRNEDGTSKYDVESLLGDAKADPSSFIEFLHHNYPSFFGEPDDMVTALENLSFADTLLPWRSEEQVRVDLSDCAASVAARGFLYSNSDPIRSGWRPIKGPQSFDVYKQRCEFVELAQESLAKLRFPRVCTKAELCELIPYAERKMQRSLKPWELSARPAMPIHAFADMAEMALVEQEVGMNAPENRSTSKHPLRPEDSAFNLVGSRPDDEEVEEIEEWEDE